MSAVSVQDSENSPPLADAPGLAGPAWGGGARIRTGRK